MQKNYGKYTLFGLEASWDAGAAGVPFHTRTKNSKENHWCYTFPAMLHLCRVAVASPPAGKGGGSPELLCQVVYCKTRPKPNVCFGKPAPVLF